MGVFYEGDAWDIVKNNELITDALPIVSVLTVAATGSEMDSSSVISNAAECDKARDQRRHSLSEMLDLRSFLYIYGSSVSDRSDGYDNRKRCNIGTRRKKK